MSDLEDLQDRIAALEAVVAFVVAAQHLQTPDPAAAPARLREAVLAGPIGPGSPALEKLLDMIQAIQAELPRRLVDG